MVTGPGWTGETPEGITSVFTRDTDFTVTIFRTQLFDPAGMPNAEKVQAGCKVQSLSAFPGQAAPAPALDGQALTPAAPGADVPKYLDFLLQCGPESALSGSEQQLRASLAQIGIKAGEPFDSSKLSADQQADLGDAIKAGAAGIDATAASVGTPVTGWQIGAAAGSSEFFDGTWALRAAGAKPGIYGTDAEEAAYPGISQINNRHPGELCLGGGEDPTKADPNMVGPYIAKADAITGKQVWRTYLDDLNISGRWIGNANLNILPDGDIVFA